ncbi:efflux RND transporter permease subunit [Verrucomicrobiaceae bacterium 5K15]|uniref:Efflux RND transporter permease subunit n=1 Tax=Oceaniferula flava TaxID=2800421 RepID=A0AAE2SAL3_9BACT|nr:efflux RND transporter permease subunit [Oceaniferula flavus]MBK1854581.1 efflux RND transporter permease subunit [Oceaniferula flavus]MBM1135887.1 efflux RND transporter permease subunit [Oceaniferula flavus]
MIRWFARNSYASNFLMLAILLAGIYAVMFKIPTEVTPTYQPSYIRVNIPLPGGTPNEVEQKIILPIESSLEGIAEIKAIRSDARRNSAEFTIETEDGIDMDKLRAEIESRIDSINTFPDEMERPQVRIPDTANWMEVISVVISGDMSEKDLLTAARQVRDDLTSLPGISKVDIIGGRNHEISIEVNRDTLHDYGLEISDLSAAIRQNSLDLSAGSINSKSSRVLLRSTNQALDRTAFEKIIVSRKNGAQITLGDIAHVRDNFDEDKKITRLNGKRCVLAEVKRLGDESALTISDMVHEYVDNAHTRFPEGVTLATWDDDSVSLRGRISTLFWNLLQGSILVFILLGVFLRLSLAFWVVVGIPISFAGGLIFMPAMDVTANIMSIFGFIIVLGIVVDDAIVTSEHIYSKLKLGMAPLEATVTGAKEIAVPVTFGVLTTVVAFIPLAFFDGWLGELAKQIPYVVIPVLLFSLIESKFILPCHLRHIKINRTGNGVITRIQRGASAGLDWFIESIYQPMLAKAVLYRYITLSIFLAVAFGCVGFVASGVMGFESIPSVDRYYISARLRMEEGSAFEQTDEQVKRIEQAAYDLRKIFTDGDDGPTLIGNIMTTTGGKPTRNGTDEREGYVLVEITPPSKRKHPGPKNQEIADAWREMVGTIQGSQSFYIRTESSGGRMMGDSTDIEIELRGHDTNEMAEVAQEIQDLLSNQEGLRRAWTSIEQEQDEFQITLLPYGRELGLTQELLARQVRRAFHGDEAQRLQRGEDSVKVVVRFPEEERESLHTLDDLRISLPNGSSVSMNQVAKITRGSSPPRIVRKDGSRIYTISTNRESRSVNINKLAEKLTPMVDDIVREHPGNSWKYEGALAETKENQNRIWVTGGLLVFVLFSLLAIPFKSITQPIFVLLAIPFGAVGAFFGHVVMDITPSFLSFFGLLALTGVVVNDSLVMVDFTNVRRREGDSPYDAVIHSGSARFRPILLTSLTTFAGLMPLIFERSIQAQFLIPMAVSLAFGIMFATFITLFLIPCAYLATEDVKNFFRKLFGMKTEPQHAEE